MDVSLSLHFQIVNLFLQFFFPEHSLVSFSPTVPQVLFSVRQLGETYIISAPVPCHVNNNNSSNSASYQSPVDELGTNSLVLCVSQVTNEASVVSVSPAPSAEVPSQLEHHSCSVKQTSDLSSAFYVSPTTKIWPLVWNYSNFPSDKYLSNSPFESCASKHNAQ